MFQDRSLLVGPTAEMAEKLADRVVLVSRMLTALKSVGGAAYARTSESQAAAVKGLLLQTSLSLEHITAMLESIVAVPWQSDQHRDDVLAALAAGPAGAIAAKPSATVASCRRPMQDFGSIVNYYTEGQWDIMLVDATIPSQKLRVVLEHAHVLGLRCASDWIVQRITTLFLSVSEGALAAKGMPTSQNMSMTKHVKHELKKRWATTHPWCTWSSCRRCRASWLPSIHASSKPVSRTSLQCL